MKTENGGSTKSICHSEHCNCASTRVCGKERSPKEWDEPFNVDVMTNVVEDRFVFFVDIMGMKNAMFRSFKRSAIFIGKFHSCVLRISKNVQNIDVFPVMDGVYVVAEEYNEVIKFIEKLYNRLSQIFVRTKKNCERFIVRGGLSYGPVVIGSRIGESESEVLAKSKEYKNKLLFGLPVVLAYEGETKAPPFGVYLDATIRIKMRDSVAGVWYKWCRSDSSFLALSKEVESYFSWAILHSKELSYDEKKINEHKETAAQFFNKEI